MVYAWPRDGEEGGIEGKERMIDTGRGNIDAHARRRRRPNRESQPMMSLCWYSQKSFSYPS